MMRSLPTLCAVIALALVFAAPAASITLPQVDDFQNGTLQNWAGGAAPTNIPDGGPGGMGDRFLRISAVDDDIGNDNLGTNNLVQWTGNYTAAEVTRLNFHLNNLGPNPLALRIALFGPGGRFTTTDETVLQPASGWVSVEFALDSASLTQTSGFGTLADTMANVQTLLIRHDPDPLDNSGVPNNVTGTLGIDNITALPEPGPVAMLAAGLPLLFGLRAVRGTRPDTAALRARRRRAGAAGALRS